MHDLPLPAKGESVNLLKCGQVAFASLMRPGYMQNREFKLPLEHGICGQEPWPIGMSAKLPDTKLQSKDN
jgi:hypothetical protein